MESFDSELIGLRVFVYRRKYSLSTFWILPLLSNTATNDQNALGSG